MFRSVVRSLIAVSSCALFAPFAASASSIFFDLDRIDDFVFPLDEFAVFIEIVIDAPDVTNVVVTAGSISMPMEEFDGVWEEADDTVFRTLADLKSALNGIWTIVVTGGANASTSSFSLNANGLVDSDFPLSPTGLSPADGATGVSANTLLSWTAIPSQFVVAVFAGDFTSEQEANSVFGGISLNASSWQPPLALPTGIVEWGVFYASDPTPIVNLVGDLSVTVGSIDWLPHPLIDATGLSGTWPETKPLMVLGSETIAEITVPEASEVLQGGVALAMLGLLAHLRVRKRGFADAA